MPMYLLQVGANSELNHEEILGRNVPPYAILSHTWRTKHKEEVSFKDIAKGRGKEKPGYEKLNFCAEQAAKDNLQHFWIDTCCIDKSSSAELQEAINSMFRWYQRSAKCYAYLTDVSSSVAEVPVKHMQASSLQPPWISAFRNSKWFTRGWTLQELLAPTTVDFFSAEGTWLGNKHTLKDEIHTITKIPLGALLGTPSALSQFGVNQRISWADHRTTTREEDGAYSLLGLFELHIPLLYGEGEDNAFRRLHEERKKREDHQKEHVKTPMPKRYKTLQNARTGSENRPEWMTTNQYKRTASEAFDDASWNGRNTKTLQQNNPETTSPQIIQPIQVNIRAQDEGYSLHAERNHDEVEHTPAPSVTPLPELSHIEKIIPVPNVIETRPNPERTSQNTNVDRIIHADIRVEEIEDTSSGDGHNSENPRQAEANKDHMKAKSTQMWWEEAVAKNRTWSEGYDRTAVLFVKWADHIEELKTRSEISKVETVFRERFHFDTEIVELNMKGKPQLQLNNCVSSFSERNDGPNNLLIVYYIGPSVFNERYHRLELVASTRADTPAMLKDAHAIWDRAEQILKDDGLDADVLTILDCANSRFSMESGKEDAHAHGSISEATRPQELLMSKSARRSTRKFELLTASPSVEFSTSLTDAFFTRSLVDSLVELSNKYGTRPFSTFQLNQQIRMDERRIDQPTSLWYRLPDDQNILLAPIRKMDAHSNKPNFSQRPRGRLTLSFDLRDETLNEEQIEYLARSLGQALQNKAIIGVRKINWVGIEPVHHRWNMFERAALAVYAFTQWKKLVRRKREESREGKEALQDPSAE